MPAYISALMISHLRSFKTARLSLDGRPVVLWGANGAGKTNLLEAVSLLSPGRGLRRAMADDIARAPDHIGWKIKADIHKDGDLHLVETTAQAGQKRQTRIDDKQAPQNRLSQFIRMVWLTPVQDRLWIEGADGRRRFLDRITLSFTPHHASVVLSYEKAMRERNKLLKNQVRDRHWYHAVEMQMAQDAAAMIQNRRDAVARLSVAQNDAQSAFPKAELHLDETIPQHATDIAHYFAENRNADIAAGRSLIGPHRDDLTAIYTAKGVAARQCSTGEQKALLLSLVLANARALRAETGSPPIVLLDEVAAHLDDHRRAALYDEICALGCQAWMTGTGPDLFTGLEGRAQFFCIEDKTGQSQITPA
jgi:DNA replication and repair protein RecF